MSVVDGGHRWTLSTVVLPGALDRDTTVCFGVAGCLQPPGAGHAISSPSRRKGIHSGESLETEGDLAVVVVSAHAVVVDVDPVDVTLGVMDVWLAMTVEERGRLGTDGVHHKKRGNQEGESQ